MLPRQELEKWLEGTGIVLLPPLSLGEKLMKMLELNSERTFQRAFILLHLFTIITLVGGLLLKIYLR